MVLDGDRIIGRVTQRSCSTSSFWMVACWPSGVGGAACANRRDATSDTTAAPNTSRKSRSFKTSRPDGSGTGSGSGWPSSLRCDRRRRQRPPKPLAGERRVPEPQRQGRERPPRARLRRPDAARPGTANHRAGLGLVLQPKHQAEAGAFTSATFTAIWAVLRRHRSSWRVLLTTGCDRRNDGGYADGVRSSFRWS